MSLAPQQMGRVWEVQVLMLLPMRNLALKAVLRLCQLAQAETRHDSVQNKQRLMEEFGVDPDATPAADSRTKRKAPPASAKAAHSALFDGNTDDFFRIGIKFTRWEAWAPLICTQHAILVPARSTASCTPKAI